MKEITLYPFGTLKKKKKKERKGMLNMDLTFHACTK